MKEISTSAFRLTKPGRTFILLAAILLLTFAGGTALQADNKDTVDDVIRVGREARAGLGEIEAGLRDAQSITARLAQDRAFAGRVLELAKKNDKNGLAALLKSIAPSSQITVKNIQDFCIGITLCTQRRCYDLCIGDCCKHPSGAKSPVVFSEY
jgi:hypothetical protein